MAALRVHDLHGRDDLGQWLGGVYVRPESRRRGVASALCRVVEEKARELGFRRLFLFTLDRQSLYARLGWSVMESTVWKGSFLFLTTPPDAGSRWGADQNIS